MSRALRFQSRQQSNSPEQRTKKSLYSQRRSLLYKEVIEE